MSPPHNSISFLTQQKREKDVGLDKPITGISRRYNPSNCIYQYKRETGAKILAAAAVVGVVKLSGINFKGGADEVFILSAFSKDLKSPIVRSKMGE